MRVILLRSARLRTSSHISEKAHIVLLYWPMLSAGFPLYLGRYCHLLYLCFWQNDALALYCLAILSPVVYGVASTFLLGL